MVDILGKFESCPGVKVLLTVSRGCFTRHGEIIYVIKEIQGVGNDCHHELCDNKVCPGVKISNYVHP